MIMEHLNEDMTAHAEIDEVELVELNEAWRSDFPAGTKFNWNEDVHFKEFLTEEAKRKFISRGIYPHEVKMEDCPNEYFSSDSMDLESVRGSSMSLEDKKRFLED